MSRKSRETIDLRKENPAGRVDCLAANLIERFACERVPELLPLLDQKREVIHAGLNERLGPHVIDPDVVNACVPFIPLVGFAVRQIAANYGPKVAQQSQQTEGKTA